MTQQNLATARKIVGLGALLIALAIILGAFGAHGLKGKLPDSVLDVYEKSVLYHLTNSIGITIIGVLLACEVISLKISKILTWILFLGVLLFSGSLYIYSTTGEKIFAMITPLGGISFIIAWITLGAFCLKKR